MGILENKQILLGVTGSIACYKSADLASKLSQAGALVDVILTQGALHFITPLTFQAVTGRPAYTDDNLWGGSGQVTHVGVGHSAELLVVAPATANTLAKLAYGMADNLLTLTALALRGKLLLAPAMEGGMFEHPATQRNLEILRERGAVIAGPAAGHLASGQEGIGRMLETEELLGHIRLALAAGGPLAGRKVVVTAGGTHEPIDPVRVISNLSSGKQGTALAQAALDYGAEVILISGPTLAVPVPTGLKQIKVQTAADMERAVLEAAGQADVLLMAAAVADFRPKQVEPEKIKKTQAVLQIPLENTSDILAAVARQKEETGFPRVTVGFAAESQDLLQNAQQKRQAKHLDLIAANDITAQDAGFAVDTNRVVLISADNSPETLPLMTKQEVAEEILKRTVFLLPQK
jgi:phosphopantothenoylcysteine decarboxylase/phosphopantothenate--cysteine ligase